MTTKEEFTFTGFNISSNSKLLFTIKPDGTIIRGEGFTTDDEMSLKFWEAVERAKRENGRWGY